uniref:Tetratricopeptide repeat protein n=1 Tax=Phenylobacterium glaciei TaxID=2803784 RepID=A0A974P575_9CAUL|nr:hypothetical protein JKL49_03865 [Phenylobacterium glaciei]
MRLEQSDPAEALKLIDRGLKLDPKSKLGLTDRGRPWKTWAARRGGEGGHRGLALYPDDNEFLYLRSGALIAQGDLAGARKDLDLYLQLSPKASAP